MNTPEGWLPTVFEWVLKNYTRLTRMLSLLAGFAILSISLISIREIIFRNLGMPSNWATEVQELMVLWIFLLPMAFTQIDGGMIRVTFLVEKLPRKAFPWFKLAASFSSFLFGLLLFKASYGFYASVVAGSYFPETGFPAAWQRGVVPACALLLTASGMLCLMRDILALISGNLSADAEE